MNENWYGYFVTTTLTRQSADGPVVYVNLFVHHHHVVSWRDFPGNVGLVPYFYRPGSYAALNTVELHNFELSRPDIKHSVLCGLYYLDEQQEDARLSQWEEIATELHKLIYNLLDEYPTSDITLTQDILNLVVDDAIYTRLYLRTVGGQPEAVEPPSESKES